MLGFWGGASRPNGGAIRWCPCQHGSNLAIVPGPPRRPGPAAGYSSHQKIEDLNCSLNLTCQFDLLKMLLAESESRYYQDTFIWIEFFS
jgi:hypothetical protein